MAEGTRGPVSPTELSPTRPPVIEQAEGLELTKACADLGLGLGLGQGACKVCMAGPVWAEKSRDGSGCYLHGVPVNVQRRRSSSPTSFREPVDVIDLTACARRSSKMTTMCEETPANDIVAAGPVLCIAHDVQPGRIQQITRNANGSGGHCRGHRHGHGPRRSSLQQLPYRLLLPAAVAFRRSR